MASADNKICARRASQNHPIMAIFGHQPQQETEKTESWGGESGGVVPVNAHHLASSLPLLPEPEIGLWGETLSVEIGRNWRGGKEKKRHQSTSLPGLKMRLAE